MYDAESRMIRGSFFYHDEDAISKQQCLYGAHELALSLRRYSSGNVVNLCENHYYFALTFMATLISKREAVLPPMNHEGTLIEIIKDYDCALCVTDGHDVKVPIPVINVASFKIKPYTKKENLQLNIPKNNIAAILFTSGSTGKSKIMKKKWGTLWKTGKIMRNYLISLVHDNPSPISVVTTLSSRHMFGFETAILSTLQDGIIVHSKSPLHPSEIVHCINEMSSPVILVTTPYHLNILVKTEMAPSSLDGILVSTSPLSSELAQQAECVLNTKVYEIYGCSEVGAIGSRRVVNQSLFTPMKGITVYHQSSGESMVSAGHLDRDIELDDNLVINKEGLFSVQGRKDDIVKIYGKRISKTQIKNILEAMPDISESVIMENPKGNRLVAFVVSDKLSPQEIARMLAIEIDTTFIPRPIVIVDAIPRNRNGKINRACLMELM